MRMKRTRRNRVTALAALLATVLALFPMAVAKPEEAKAALVEAGTVFIEGVGNLRILYEREDGYVIGLDKNENLVITGTYHHNSQAELSYHTKFLYFTKEDTGGDPTSVGWGNYAEFKVDHGDGTLVPGTDLSRDTYRVSVQDLKVKVPRLFGEKDFKGPYTVYLSEGFVLKRRPGGKGDWKYDSAPVYKTLEGIRGAANWSSTTEANFANYFDAKIVLDLEPIEEEKVVKKAHKVIIDTYPSDGRGGIAGGGGEFREGETVSPWASANTGWMFSSWTGGTAGLKIKDLHAEDISFIMPNRDVHLTANFEKSTYTETPEIQPKYKLTLKMSPKGGGSATGAGEYYEDELARVQLTVNDGWRFAGWLGTEGLDIERKATKFSFFMPARNVTLTARFVKQTEPVVTEPPTPTPAPTATPMPTPTPSQPKEDKIGYVENYRYYTTDKGYSIDALSQNVEIANRVGVKSGSAANMFIKNGTYSVGTDAAGNEWYFIPYGSEATFVHPKKYDGYRVAESEVRHIKELTFPETISSGGVNYTVISIGGGLSWYNTMEPFAVDVCDRRSYSSDGTGGGYHFSLGNTYGYYRYEWIYAYNDNFIHTTGDDMSYQFGVVGNGSITSHGEKLQYWQRSGAEWRTDYASTYTVYNTTLGEITIPPTVRRIEDYAFANCNALSKINGGYGVQEIGQYAFMAGSEGLKLSETAENDSSRYYSYNKSYTLALPWTDVMLEYDATRKLCSHMQLAAFPKLKTIHEYAFLNRANLHDVVLPKGVGSIKEGAFQGCELNSIEVPGMSTIINEDRNTLGTKGYRTDESRTLIITEPESTAMYYGLNHAWYYKVRCGYDVIYDNNFMPEETYHSKTELKQRLASEKTSVDATSILFRNAYIDIYPKIPSGSNQVTGGTVILDTEGNVWYQYGKNENIIPQALEFGSKVVELRQDIITEMRATYTYWYSSEYHTTGDSYVPLNTATVVTETGDIYYFSGATYDPSDSETPYKSSWTQLNVPEGAQCYQWVERVADRSDGEQQYYEYYKFSEWEKTKIYERKLFYLAPDGSIEYLSLGEVTHQIDGEDYYSSQSEESSSINRRGVPKVKSVVNNSRKRLTLPGSTRFERIAIAPEVYGGAESRSKTSSGGGEYFRSEDYYTILSTQPLKLPTIYATATDGTLWKASVEKTSSQSYIETDSYKTGVPIEEIVLSPTDYVWSRVESEQEGAITYRKTSDFSGKLNIGGSDSMKEDAFNHYYILKNGALMYHDEAAKSDKRLAPDVAFSEFYTVDGLVFAMDETGYLWMLAIFGNEPMRLFNDADVTKIFSAQHRDYGVTHYEYYIHKWIYLADSLGRFWEIQVDANSSSGTRGKLSPAKLIMGAGSPVKKIDQKWTVNYDFDNRTIEGYSLSMLILREDGSLWAYGSSCNEGKWSVERLPGGVIGYSPKGYDFIIGPKYFYDTAEKVSGDIVFVDMVHKKNYSLAMDEQGNVYRTGYYYDSKTGEITPAKYQGFTLVDEEMEYNGTDFITGYHFVETLYDSMFERENYVFLHWNEQEDNSGAFLYPGEDLIVEAPVRLHAQWEKVCNKVRYHPNGASGFMEDTVTDPPAGNKVTLRKNTYYMGGYVFNGWNTKADGTGISYADEAEFVMQKGTTVLFAMWKKADKYTLKVATDEESVRPVEFSSTHRLDYDEYFTMPEALADRVCLVDYRLNKQSNMSTTPKWITATPFTDEYTTSWQEFMCWTLYEEEVNNAKYNFLSRMFYPGAKANRLTQHMDYASVLFPLWSGAESYVLLPEAACDGYWLIGWAESAAGKNGFVDAPEGSGAMYKPTKPKTTLYAYYEPKQYDIELVAEAEDAESGEITQKQTLVQMTFDAVLPNVVPPESEVYTFMGYYDKLDENGIPTEDAVMYYDETGAPALDESGNPMVWRIHDGSVEKLYAHMVSEIRVELDGRGATKQVPGENSTYVYMTYNEKGPDIIPPEKTGYTFGGYYTKIRGKGKQYFAADGHGTARWTEKKVRVLYAYWIQDAVVPPEREDGKTPEPDPENTVIIDAKRTDGVLQLYADDNDPSTGAETDKQPYLVSDVVVDGELTVAGAIPSTENVALRAKLGAWMLYCSLTKKSGVDMVRVHVTVPYRTQYEKKEDEALVISKRQTRTVDVLVPKEWSYWILEEGDIYFPEKVVVQNDSIKGTTVEVPVTWEGEHVAEKPEYRITSYGEKENHVSFGSYDTDGTPGLSITLTEEQYIVSDVPGQLPDVEEYLSVIAHNAAWKNTTQLTVKSDNLYVAGVTLLSDAESDTGHGSAPQEEAIRTITEKIPETTYSQTYKSGIPLLPTAPNGRYDTRARIVYRAGAEAYDVRQGESGEKDTQTKEVRIGRTNEINIHTPVVCIPELVAEHEDMHQCRKVPADCTVLVLDEKDRYSEFSLKVGNTGYHSGKKGYGERNYAEYLSEKNEILRNEVCFPFDVWLDKENDRNKENDVLLTKGEWYVLGKKEQYFYVPVWTEEGSYEIKVRSVAVNGVGKETESEPERNSLSENYTAENTVKVYVTGRLYDFTVHEVKGTAIWDTASEEGLCYTVGVRPPEYSLWDTLPLRKGVHPLYRNLGGLPRGGTVSFSVKSVGISCGDGAKVQAVPYLLAVENGICYEVDVYYEEETEHGPVLRAWNPAEKSISLLGGEEDNGVRQWNGAFTLPKKLYVTERGTDVWTYRKQHGLSFTEDFWITEVPLMLRFFVQMENTKGELLYYGMIPEEIANNIWQREAEVLVREDHDKNVFTVSGGETAVIYPGDCVDLWKTFHGIY